VNDIGRMIENGGSGPEWCNRPPAVKPDPNHENDRRGTRERWFTILPFIQGDDVLDVGCAHGDGYRFLPEGTWYTGVDINAEKIPFRSRYWWQLEEGPMVTMYEADIRSVLAESYRLMLGNLWSTIVALEIIEHVEDGLALAQTLRGYGERVIISVPKNRSGPQEIRNGHVLMNLTAEDFPGYVEIPGLVAGSLVMLCDRGEVDVEGLPEA